jgi:hypothetical protein
VPGELSIIVHPLTALAHRQKEKTGRAVNSMTHHEAGSQDDKAKWKQELSLPTRFARELDWGKMYLKRTQIHRNRFCLKL